VLGGEVKNVETKNLLMKYFAPTPNLLQTIDTKGDFEITARDKYFLTPTAKSADFNFVYLEKLKLVFFGLPLGRGHFTILISFNFSKTNFTRTLLVLDVEMKNVKNKNYLMEYSAPATNLSQTSDTKGDFEITTRDKDFSTLLAKSADFSFVFLEKLKLVFFGFPLARGHFTNLISYNFSKTNFIRTLLVLSVEMKNVKNKNYLMEYSAPAPNLSQTSDTKGDFENTARDKVFLTLPAKSADLNFVYLEN